MMCARCCPLFVVLETIFRRCGTLQCFKNTTQTIQKTCHKHVYKTCLKLDVRPIIYAYNLLGYGETLSETSGKSQKMSTMFENTYCLFNQQCPKHICYFNNFKCKFNNVKCNFNIAYVQVCSKRTSAAFATFLYQ